MSGLFAGPHRLLEWIEPLVARALLSKKDNGDNDDDDDVSKKHIVGGAKIVQVFSLGRPCSSSQQEPDYEKVIPTSLLISDGQTTILGILSQKARQNLGELANDNSVDTFQNNTISRGCVIKITDWKLDTLEQACQESRSTEYDPPSLFTTMATKEKLFEADPLICGRSRSDKKKKNTIVTNTVILNLQGPIEIMGGHGLSVVGRPEYIMDTIDVRRAYESLDQDEIRNRILADSAFAQNNDQDSVTPKSNAATEEPTKGKKRKRIISQKVLRKRQSEAAATTTSSCLNHPGSPSAINEIMNRDVTKYPGAPTAITEANNRTNADVPLGDVMDLFTSPNKERLTALCDYAEQQQCSSICMDTTDNTSNLTSRKKQQNSITAQPSQKSDDTIPVANFADTSNPKAMQQLFGDVLQAASVSNTLAEDERNATKKSRNNVNDNDTNNSQPAMTQTPGGKLQLHSEDVLSMGDSDDDEKSEEQLGISNMLILSEEEEQVANIDTSLSGAVLVDATQEKDSQPKDRLASKSQDIATKKGTHQQPSGEAISLEQAPAVENAQNANGGANKDVDDDDDEDEFFEAEQNYEQPLESQPIHAVEKDSDTLAGDDHHDDDDHSQVSMVMESTFHRWIRAAKAVAETSTASNESHHRHNLFHGDSFQGWMVSGGLDHPAEIS